MTDIRGTDGIVNYQVKTSDTDGQEVVLQILDANGNEVAQAKGTSGEIVIPDAKLWEPYPGTRICIRQQSRSVMIIMRSRLACVRCAWRGLHF